MKTKTKTRSAQDVVGELFAGVDLPSLVQRMLVIMHEVRCAAQNRTRRTVLPSAPDKGKHEEKYEYRLCVCLYV